MINYIKQSFKRKFARRFTKEYKTILKEYNLEKEGKICFLDWDNPLSPSVEISQLQIDFFRSFINEGDLVLDIGANIGDTTVPMAIAAGKTGATLGFDPNPFVFRILRKNAALNTDKTNIEPYNLAVASKTAEYYFISSEASFANGGISSQKDSKHGKFIFPSKVKGVKLSLFLEKKYKDVLQKLSFIKVDTEGYDKEILKSIRDLITKYKPTIIAESFGKASNEAKVELFEVLSGYGYDIFYFSDFIKGTLIQPIKTAEQMIAYKHTINVYAVFR